jgi:hypothetical protein
VLRMAQPQRVLRMAQPQRVLRKAKPKPWPMRINAISAVRIAREQLIHTQDFEARPNVLRALYQVELAMSAPSSECRLAKPFAPIVQVADSPGVLHYECTHAPRHFF